MEGRQENTDLNRLIRTYTDGALAFCKPCAAEILKHMARTMPCATPPYISVLFRTYPYRHCPQYRLCGMCTASRRECAMFFGESTPHGARGETLLFPPCTPFSPVCCKMACGTQCGSLSYRARTVSRPGGKRYGLNARCHSAAPKFLGLSLHHCAAIPSLGPCALGTHGLAPVY